MKRSAESRIPVHLHTVLPCGAGDPGAAWLAEEDGSAHPGIAECFAPALSAHVAGCACCGGRGAAALAFSRLFLRRARGELSFTAVHAVVKTPAGAGEIRAALRDDPFVAARYRPA